MASILSTHTLEHTTTMRIKCSTIERSARRPLSRFEGVNVRCGSYYSPAESYEKVMAGCKK